MASAYKGTISGLPEGESARQSGQRGSAQAVSSRRPAWLDFPFKWAAADPNRQVSSSSALAELAVRVFRLGGQLLAEEEIEDGMFNAYQNEVECFVISRGGEAVRMMASLLPSQDPELQGYTLRYLSQLNHPITKHARLSLILSNLSSPNPGVRYEAAMAVATMRAKHSYHVVENALSRELLPNLRNTMIAVLDELKA